MMYTANKIAFITYLLLAMGLILKLPILSKLKFKTITGAIGILILLVMISYIPLYNGLCLPKILRGMIGEPSITTLIVLSILFLNRVGLLKCSLQYLNVINSPSAFLLFIIATVLYSSVFGFIRFDIYSYGYYSKYFLVFFIVLELMLWFINQLLSIIWLIAFAAFYFKLQISINLWDYLLDPIVYIMCIFYAVKPLLYYTHENELSTSLFIKDSPKYNL